ncbi:hypothetical protein C8Q73DRAFT_667335 [Cubamyces lactineus]|nr:hypothetical protein C8Q73DRAFT_667335 [Cubamyces lactineus]
MAIPMLPRRSKCVHIVCRSGGDGCSNFVVIANGVHRLTALTPAEPCSACGHAWFSHSITGIGDDHPNPSFQRGGFAESNCGGFASTCDPASWSFPTVCQCGRALRSHDFLADATAATLASHDQGQPMPQLHTDERPAGVGFGGAMLARGLRLPAAAPPITAYHGVRAAEPGPTRGSSQASGSRQNIARIRSQLAASGSSTAHPAEVLPAGEQDFCVLVIPHIPPTLLSRLARHPSGSTAAQPAYPSPAFRWSAGEFTDLASVLLQLKLVFAVSLSSTGPVAQELTRQILAHCDTSNVLVPGFSSTALLPSAPTSLPFILLAQGTRRRGTLERLYDPYDELDINHFTSARLTTRPFANMHLPLDDALSALPMIIVAPRYTNLRSSIGRRALMHLVPWSEAAQLSNRYYPHQCFAARVMHIVAPAIDWGCISGECAPASLGTCEAPSVGSPANSEGFLPLSDTVPAMVSVPGELHPAVRDGPAIAEAHVPPSFGEPLFLNETLEVYPSHGSRNDNVQEVRHELTPLVAEAGSSSLPSIRDRSDSMEMVLANAHPAVRLCPGVGEDTASVPRESLAPEDVTVALTSLGMLVTSSGPSPAHLDFEVGEGIGEAPIRTVLRLAVKLAVEDKDLWEPRGRYMSILSPEASTALAPWVNLDVSTPLDIGSNSAVGRLLYGANINPCSLDLSQPPSQADLSEIEQSIVSEMLLGYTDLTGHPDLVAFGEGAVCVLAPGSSLAMTFRGQIRDYLAFMYDCRVMNADQLISHIQFKSGVKVVTVLDNDSDDSGPLDDASWDLINEDLFKTHLLAYLRGHGHPSHPYIQAILSPAMIAAAHGDSSLRARGFLQLMSGSELFPVDPQWSLKLYFNHTGDRTYVPLDGVEPPLPGPLEVHACFYEATVQVDNGLRNLLREERHAGGAATAFDAWIHGAILEPDVFTVA